MFPVPVELILVLARIRNNFILLAERLNNFTMEPFTLSLIGLACLILIIILTVLGTLVYSGLFESVVVASGNPPIGKATIAYIHGKGAYKEIGQVFTRLSTYLPANKEFKMLGIYYDDPDKTPTHLQRLV